MESYYFERYGDIDLHRRMIADRRRTEAFARALAELVGPSDVVLDVGTGTGILAMLAARAGAKKVYGFEQAGIAAIAEGLVEKNGLRDRVEIVQGPAGVLRTPERVDLIVSEWLGHFALVEGMLDDLLLARDHNLAPGGRMLPAAIEIHLAPVDDPVLYHQDGPGFWRERRHGLDLSSLESAELRQGRAVPQRVHAATLLAESAVLVSLDVATAGPEDAFVSGTARFRAARSGVLNGFGGWFVARLSPNVVLDTGPHEPDTHWGQTYFPFSPRMVVEGSELGVEFALARDPEERRRIRLSLEIDGARQSYVME